MREDRIFYNDFVHDDTEANMSRTSCTALASFVMTAHIVFSRPLLTKLKVFWLGGSTLHRLSRRQFLAVEKSSARRSVTSSAECSIAYRLRKEKPIQF